MLTHAGCWPAQETTQQGERKLFRTDINQEQKESVIPMYGGVDVLRSPSLKQSHHVTLILYPKNTGGNEIHVQVHILITSRDSK